MEEETKQPEETAVSTPAPANTGTPAPFGTRLVAGIIDMLIASGLSIIPSLVLPHFAQKLTFLLWAGYLLTRDTLPFLGGQSIGKKAMKLRAVTLDGKPLTNNWEAGIIRNLILIPCTAPVELIVLLIRESKPEKGTRLGDEWAKTKVIIADNPSA